MHFLCETQKLLEGLNIVTKAIASRSTTKILEGVLLESTQKGLKLTCTDGNLTINTYIDANIKDEGSIVLPGKLLTEFIRKFSIGNVEIKTNHNFAATIKCQKNKTTISGKPSDEFPSSHELEDEYSIILPQNKLKNMLSKVIFSIAADDNRQILTGCYLEIKPDEIIAVALDGFRLALHRYKKNVSDFNDKKINSAIIPGKAAQELARILEDKEEDVTLTLEKSYLKASFGKTELKTTLISGEYIDFEKILPESFSTSIKVKNESIIESIERASLMAREGKNNLIHLNISDGLLTITSNAELGDVYEEVTIDLVGKDIKIAFNSRYISEAIRNIDEEEFMLSFNNSISPCVIKPLKGEEYLYLILPVRTFSE